MQLGGFTFAVAFIVISFVPKRSGESLGLRRVYFRSSQTTSRASARSTFVLLIGRCLPGLLPFLAAIPSAQTFAVNIMSGKIAFCCYVYMLVHGHLCKIAWIGSGVDATKEQGWTLAISGGCGTYRSILSVWFSAVEGEVYAMSTFLPLWYYGLP